MPAYWSLLSVTGPQFYRADSNTPRSVYFKIRQIAAVLEWRLHRALGLNRSTVYAHSKRAANDEPPRRCRKQSVQPRALSAQERAVVVETLHSEP